MNNTRKGLILAFFAYLAWSLLSLYWKALSSVPAYTTFAYRIIWTSLTMLLYFLVTGQRKRLGLELSQLFKSPRQLTAMLFAGFFIALNWLTYIFAVGSGQATEASLGYYLMPLVSVFLSLVFLGERLARTEWVAVCLASLGVLILIMLTGKLPLITLILALSFGTYGLLKKQVSLSSDVAMLFEAGLILPLALTYLVFFNQSSWFSCSLMEQVLLALSGVITAIPLLLFAEAVKLAPLNQVGFFQYMNPTIQLIIAIFVFKEGIRPSELIGFSLIWLAVLVFLWAQLPILSKEKARK